MRSLTPRPTVQLQPPVSINLVQAQGSPVGFCSGFVNKIPASIPSIMSSSVGGKSAPKNGGGGPGPENPDSSIPPAQRLINLEKEQPPDIPNPAVSIGFYIMRAKELHKHAKNFMESNVYEQSFHNFLRSFTIMDSRLQTHPEYKKVKPEDLEEIQKLHGETKELVETCRKMLLEKWQGEYDNFLKKQVKLAEGTGAPAAGENAKGGKGKNKKGGNGTGGAQNLSPVPTQALANPKVSIPTVAVQNKPIVAAQQPLPPPTAFASEPNIKMLSTSSKVKTEIGVVGAGDHNYSSPIVVEESPRPLPSPPKLHFRPQAATSILPVTISAPKSNSNPEPIPPFPGPKQTNSNGVKKPSISTSTPAFPIAPTTTNKSNSSFQVIWNNQLFEASKDGVKALLKCESCKGFLQSPIYLCKTGHSGCLKCVEANKLCCKEPFTKLRNTGVESLVESYTVSCSYKKFGCTTKCFSHEIEVHQKKCNFRPFDCNLIGSHHACANTKVSSVKIQDHVLHGHGLRGYNSDNVMWIEKVNLDDAALKLDYQLREDFTLSCFEQVFLVTSEWRMGTLFLVILLVGNKDEADKFKGELTVGNKFSQLKWFGSISSFRQTPLLNYQRGQGLILCGQQIKGLGTVEAKNKYKLELNVKIIKNKV